jgi:CRISPR system Cascade subunit CasC
VIIFQQLIDNSNSGDLMTTPRFIQIHTLHTYPAALLNRDDAGLAKRLPFGNATRVRVSSQCLKRHWRQAEDQFALSALSVPMAVRSRHLLQKFKQDLINKGVPADLAQIIVESLRQGGLLDKANKNKTGKDALKTEQVVLMGLAEIDYLVTFCCKLAKKHQQIQELQEAIKTSLKNEKKNIEALKHGSGLEAALFGRMVTSDILTTREAAVYVAHAWTVHAAQVENDYFTVVDDLNKASGELGSAGIFDTELTSGLYYGYVVVDIPQLVENLEAIQRQDCFAAQTTAEQRSLSAQVVAHLLHLIATVSPGAKRGSTAPFAYAQLMLVEAGDWQPRSLAEAFHHALPLRVNNGQSLSYRAASQLQHQLTIFDQTYGATTQRRCLNVEPETTPHITALDLSALATWTRDIIQAGVC